MLRSQQQFFQSGYPGDTALHRFIRGCTNPKELQDYLYRIGMRNAVNMAKTANDSGYLPIDLLDLEECHGQVSADLKMKAVLVKILVPYTVHNHLKDMRELLATDDIVDSYAHLSNPRLSANLALACRAANVARTIIQGSKTHPCTNDFSIEDKYDLMVKVDELRAAMKSANHCEPREYLTKNLQTQREFLRNDVGLIFKYRVGNCGEYSSMVLNQIQKTHPEKCVEIYEVTRGDHIIAVIDRDPASNPNDFTSWGANAVICDAWAGKVYAVSALRNNLSVFCSRVFGDDRERYDVVSFFNEKVHGLRLWFSLRTEQLLVPRLR